MSLSPLGSFLLPRLRLYRGGRHHPKTLPHAPGPLQQPLHAGEQIGQRERDACKEKIPDQRTPSHALPDELLIGNTLLYRSLRAFDMRRFLTVVQTQHPQVHGVLLHPPLEVEPIPQFSRHRLSLVDVSIPEGTEQHPKMPHPPESLPLGLGDLLCGPGIGKRIGISPVVEKLGLDSQDIFPQRRRLLSAGERQVPQILFRTRQVLHILAERIRSQLGNFSFDHLFKGYLNS